MCEINGTHDPRPKSWVSSANEAGGDFPIQNLPFGRFRRGDSLPNSKLRSFLEDGGTLTLRGWCEWPGAVRIGLGECSGTVVVS